MIDLVAIGRVSTLLEHLSEAVCFFESNAHAIESIEYALELYWRLFDKDGIRTRLE